MFWDEKGGGLNGQPVGMFHVTVCFGTKREEDLMGNRWAQSWAQQPLIRNPSSTGLRLACDGLDGTGDISLECR